MKKKSKTKGTEGQTAIPRLVLELCNGDKRGISPNYALVGGFFFPHLKVFINLFSLKKKFNERRIKSILNQVKIVLKKKKGAKMKSRYC